MTSKPSSRSARAMIFAPRSWPSRPGLATRMRTLRESAIWLRDLFQECDELRGFCRQRRVRFQPAEEQARLPGQVRQPGRRIVSDEKCRRKLFAVRTPQPLGHPVDVFARVERALFDDSVVLEAIGR